MGTHKRLSECYKATTTWIERLLAVVILGGILMFSVSSMQTMAAMDWRATETFYDLI